MGSQWIPILFISTGGELRNAQAVLNVIISVLGTAGLWAFSRFWWQRGSSRMLRTRDDIPLSKTFAISTLGEGCDIIKTLRRKIYAKENWSLLLQIVIIIAITMTCALAGPISKVSLRKGQAFDVKTIEVLPVVQGSGYKGNILDANVLFNTTMESLNDAHFPMNQLLDMLPPRIEPPWVYHSNQWDPTWQVDCRFEDDVEIPHLTASGDSSLYYPVDAFPALRDTYDPMWLDTSEFRLQTDYAGREHQEPEGESWEYIFFIHIQSDPAKNDRMYSNNETLMISLTAVHIKGMKLNVGDNENGSDGGYTSFPSGQAESASYMRAECTIARREKKDVDEEKIPWPWTNDTRAMVGADVSHFGLDFFQKASRGQEVHVPSSRELFRLYQVYMVTKDTFESTEPFPVPISCKIKTVELSVVSLVVLIVVFLLTACTSIRYFVFLRRNREGLRECYVPDGKMGWMIHAVKCSDPESCMAAASTSGSTPPVTTDSEHFCSAVFGPPEEKDAHGEERIGESISRMPRIARVKTSRTPSVSVADSRRGSAPALLSGQDDSIQEHQGSRAFKGEASKE